MGAGRVTGVDGVALAAAPGVIVDGCGPRGGAALLPLQFVFVEDEHGQVGARARHVAGPTAAGREAMRPVHVGAWPVALGGAGGAVIAVVGGHGRQWLGERSGEGGRRGDAADVAGAADARMGVGMA